MATQWIFEISFYNEGKLTKLFNSQPNDVRICWWKSKILCLPRCGTYGFLHIQLGFLLIIIKNMIYFHQKSSMMTSLDEKVLQHKIGATGLFSKELGTWLSTLLLLERCEYIFLTHNHWKANQKKRKPEHIAKQSFEYPIWNNWNWRWREKVLFEAHLNSLL